MGGGTISQFYGGDTAVMRGDIELMGGPPVPQLGKTLPVVNNKACPYRYKRKKLSEEWPE